MRFRIGLLYTRFAGMPQALWGALRDDGHHVLRPEDLGLPTPLSAGDMARFAGLVDPDVLFCPFLTEVVPAGVCERWTTWIPHPGIRGDAGPSSLSWAILEGEPTWGLTMVRAEPSRSAEDLDSGNVGPWREFPLPADATVAEVYAQHVTPAAVACAREVLDRMAIDPGYAGIPPGALGSALRFRPVLRQDRLAFAWDDHPDAILRRIRAATHGVRTELGGRPVNVFDAHPHHTGDARFRPGRIVAHRDGAVLVGAGGGGAVWIGHARVRRADGGRGLKLPAAEAVGPQLARVRERALHPDRRRGCPATYQAIRYKRVGRVGWIHALPYNGACSTTFCERLLAALRYAAAQDTDAIAVAGGRTAWSNGIHLGVIEAAEDPESEAWANICRMDDVAELVFGLSRGTAGGNGAAGGDRTAGGNGAAGGDRTAGGNGAAGGDRTAGVRPQTTVAVLGASAGAGGAVLSACFDVVLARPGINLNYHYATVGLSGSELRSLVLPLRAGEDEAKRLLHECLPVTPAAARRLGLVDDVGPEEPAAFVAWAQRRAAEIAADPGPPVRPIDPAPFRAGELEDMRLDIFEDRDGFAAKRRAFLGVP